MKYLFIAHTAKLLKELYPPTNHPILHHPQDTPIRLNTLEQILKNAGEYVRVSDTLWFLKTKYDVDHVYQNILAGFHQIPGKEEIGDVFVIQANEFAGNGPENALSRVNILIGIANPNCSTKNLNPSSAPDLPISEDRGSYLQRLNEEYGIKPTDAMHHKLPGSFESNQR